MAHTLWLITQRVNHMNDSKTYASLTKFKQEIERKGKEKVLSFDGAHLYTKRGSKKIRYGLYLGQIIETTVFKE